MSSIRTDMIDNYWISTAQRYTSIQSCGEVYYYETMVWEWDHNTKLLGKICFQNNSGIFKKGARIEHERIVKVFRYLAYRKRRNTITNIRLEDKLLQTVDMVKILLDNPKYKAEYYYDDEYIFTAYISQYGELCLDTDNNLLHLQLEDNRVWKIIKIS